MKTAIQQNMQVIRRTIELTFNLPEDILLKKHPSGEPLKSYGGVNLSEIRRAASYHLSFRFRPYQIYGMLDLDHSSFGYMMKTARQFVQCGDRSFGEYLLKIQEAIELNPPETITHMGVQYKRCG
jgi:hypothetical protein